MSDFEFQITGLEELGVRLGRTAGDIHRAATAGLYEEAEAVMADSKEKFVPVDEGTLRGTGHVEAPRTEADGATVVTMAYGGPAAPYAVIVHENPEAHHPVGQWKYLETPLMQAAHDMPERLAARIRADIKS